jgi:signal transduction histidine kinase
LVASAQASGLPVRLNVAGSARGVPASTGLTAYRLIQEGLANAAHHAPGADISVSVVREGAALRVEVVNAVATGRQT